jgi:signal transduction histidine kinase/AmiR/NasT family two-component response regulator/HPt (histidine-containing phosphotransfer) domain-containing protein
MNSEINRRILIIDDNESIHKDFKLILGSKGCSVDLNEEKKALFEIEQNLPRSQAFEVDSAFQGKEGLEKIQQALQEGRPYAMAFVDVRMPPGWDGIETIQKIWQEYSDLQVVICTAYSDYSWHDIIKKLGETEKLLILKKPFDNIEVYQLASAMTEKWYLSQQAKLKHEELESIVRERTKQLQDTNSKLIEVNKELAIALEKAERAERAKSEFLANMSHEIRTPMNSVIGFSDILFEENITKEQKEYIGFIRQSAKSLMQIINDILDFSKIEAGKLEIKAEECDINQILESIGSVFNIQAQEKGLKFKILLGDKLPSTIYTDSGRLRQCLVNIVNNAIKFTEKGYVHLTASSEDRNSQPHIRFDVEDTGIGIPLEMQQEVFKSFTQADGGTSRKYGGTGLGLAITKYLADLLGGEITLTSKEGKGSLFSLVIPVCMGMTRQPTLDVNNGYPVSTGNEAKEPSELSGHILIAEDVETNRKLVNFLLKRMGLETTTVTDGKEAVQKALEHGYDLILMDIQMPCMNGYEATKALRKAGIQTPIIALTAYAMKGDDQKCIEAGCDDYLPKPVDRQQLLEKLRKFLPSKSQDLIKEVDSVQSQTNELLKLCDEKPCNQSDSKDNANAEVNETIINLDHLINKLGDEKSVREIMPTYLEDNKKLFEKLTKAVKTDNTNEINRYAHAIKGTARNLGAERLSQTAEHLESAAKEGNTQIIRISYEEMKAEFEKLLTFLSKTDWVKDRKSEKIITARK